MKAEETRFWSFVNEKDPKQELLVEEGDWIKCNECKEFSPLSKWSEAETYCEDCGTHAAMRCPLCEEMHDHVWSEDSPMAVARTNYA